MNTHRVLSLCQQVSGCAHQADCSDTHCPGRPSAWDRANEKFWSDEVRDAAVITSEDMGDFFWMAAAFICLFVIGVPALIWFMRSWPILFAASQF